MAASFHVLKRNEGGAGAVEKRRQILNAIPSLKGKVFVGESCYIGHSAVYVRTSDKRKLERINRICFGR